MLRVLCNVMIQKPRVGDTTVESFFNAVAVLREEDICSVQIVTSPTSPKPRPWGGGDQSNPPPPPTVSVDLVARGLGPAGSVAIPLQTWDNVVQTSSLQAMGDVQLPRAEVTPVVAAMTQALHGQGHLVRTEKGMPFWGSRPSAPVFVTPKLDGRCSFIMNCKEGNKRDPNPQPSMRLSDMWSLHRQLLAWKGSKDAHALNVFACTFDLRNCFTSLCLPPQAWGTFRVQGEGDDLYDLRSLPFGWKLSPPLCQAVVGTHVRQAFDIMTY